MRLLRAGFLDGGIYENHHNAIADRHVPLLANHSLGHTGDLGWAGLTGRQRNIGAGVDRDKNSTITAVKLPGGWGGGDDPHQFSVFKRRPLLAVLIFGFDVVRALRRNIGTVSDDPPPLRR